MAFLNQWRRNRFRLKFKNFCISFIICLVFIGLLVGGLYASFLHQKRSELRAVFKRNLDLGQFYLTTELQKLTRDLEFLSTSPLVRHFADHPDEDLKNSLTSRFRSFVNLNAKYDQIRILSMNGQEILRVNYADARAKEVSPDKLRDRSGCYYFDRVLALPPGHLYVSPLDLNVKQLEVERPFKPIIRVATKLTDEQGRATGILILNYLAANLFRGLDEIRIGNNGQFLLVNQDGYYLKAADPMHEWGHILDDRQEFSLTNDRPQLWQSIQQANTGFYDSSDILAGYQRLNTRTLLHDPKTRKLIPPAMPQQWILIDQVPAETLSLLILPYKRSLSIGVALLVFLCFIGSGLLNVVINQRNRSNQQSRQLVAILDECPVGLAIADRRGRIQYANRKILDLSGLSLEQLSSSPLRHIDEHVLSAGNLPAIRKAIDTGKSWSQRFEDPNEELNIVRELVISPFESPEEGQKELILIMRDVTHEAELEQQLHQAQKLEAVGQLGAGIAHDFNNLLQIILGASKVLGHKVESEGKVAELLKMISQAAERGAALTRQLLTYTRSSTNVHKERYCPDRQIENSLQMIHSLLGQLIQIEFTAGAKNAEICVDHNMFEQALLNLYINAKDAMPEGGSLCLRSQLIDRDQLSDVLPPAESQHKEYYQLSIRDSGCGIPKELQKKIFEPFFTTKRSGKGTGLGLASVYNIIHQHKGVITVKSREGSGTTFDIYLPACQLTASAEDRQTVSLETLKGRGEPILLAEDDEQVRKIAGMALEEANYSVIYAENGQQAIELYNQHRKDIRFAVLDVIMPLVNGRDVFAHIRRADQNLPILFVSGHDFNLLRDIGLDDEQQVLSKPFTAEMLLQKVAEQLQV